MEHENEHLDIREKLLRLPKLQADDNFLKRLQIQIDVLDSEERTRDVVVRGSASGFFKNLFGARLVPALGISSVVVAAFLVYFVLADKKDSVVNNMTSNKTPQTTITTEKPGSINSTPSPGNNEIAKNEDKNSESKNSNNKEIIKGQDSYGLEGNTKTSETKTIDVRKNLEQNLEPLKKSAPNNELTMPEVKGGITQLPKDRVGSPPPAVKSEENLKLADEESKKDVSKIEKSGTTSTEQEKSINEGGRGNTDAKKPQSSVKPKKKDINSNTDINKSVLESLRDKLK